MKLLLLVLLFTSSLVLEFVGAVKYPVGITNCGLSSWIPKAPERVISMNQGTTEILLALGLANKMIGTAYLDDEIWSELEDDYDTIEVLSNTYPTGEQIKQLQPDFLYASYSSAFATSHVNYTTDLIGGFLNVEDDCSLTVERSNGENRTHCRQELHDVGIHTYLQEPFCELVEHRPTKLTIDVLLEEIWDIATIFNVMDNGRVVIDNIEDHFQQAIQVSTKGNDGGNGVVIDDTTTSHPIRVLWLDSITSDGEPFAGVCCGAPNIILEHAGAINVLGDVGIEDRKSWEVISWDDVVAADPDLIVVVEASWDTVGKCTYIMVMIVFLFCTFTLSLSVC